VAEFTLPGNSRITRGREWNSEQGERVNCANVCPKCLNPAKAIAEEKKLIARRYL
jgi:succinate dehydrogenase/fumarate reductase-like Fe-S protein